MGMEGKQANENVMVKVFFDEEQTIVVNVGLWDVSCWSPLASKFALQIVT
jgi:hypothetical protein